MFLETLDVRSNDVVIFSQNKFDFGKNFWLIHKNKKVKIPLSINYFEVCEFVKNDIPKNLVVYRLLTNSNQIDAYSTKFGYFINIAGEMEIVYFDPVFALRDLNHLKFAGDTDKFRFKIQQLGLTSLLKKSNGANFSIVYTSDLRAYEAQNQNDKIFADAIFAFDDSYNDNIYVINQHAIGRKAKIPKLTEEKKIYSSQSKIIEVKKEIQSHLNKLDLPDKTQAENIREKKMNMLKQALGINDFKKEDDAIVSNLSNNAANFVEHNASIKKNEILGLFKSAEKQNKNMDNNFVLKISK